MRFNPEDNCDDEIEKDERDKEQSNWNTISKKG